jgi:hypothetical protein
LIAESADGLADMLTRPGIAFKCGPGALSRILRLQPTADPARSLKVLQEVQSTLDGLSLSAVEAISKRAGMGYQMAFRSQGAPLLMPAVVHWKLGHFAALLGRNASGRLLVGDPTFGEDIIMSASALDEEASGYFLVAAGQLPAGWRHVSPTEGGRIWGRGDTGNSHDTGATGCPEVHAFPTGSDGGCTAWNVEAMVDGLSLHDDPIGYDPPLGPKIRFPLDYSQRDQAQPPLFTYTNFGNKWTSGWLSYVTDNAGCAGFYGDVVTLVVGEGSAPGAIPRPADAPAQGAPNYVQNLIISGAAVAPGTFCSQLYRRGGGTEPYLFPGPTPSTQFNQSQTGTSSVGQFSQATLTRVVDASGNVSSYIRNLPDGSIERFTLDMPGSGGVLGGKNFLMTDR